MKYDLVNNILGITNTADPQNIAEKNKAKVGGAYSHSYVYDDINRLISADGKALTHEFEGSHVDLGAEICKRYKEHPVVINAIYAHHGHEEATSVESAAVCAADALSAARPGARREVLESFLKRVEEIENIAKSKEGIKQAYAINAGREIRVIANAKLINDDEAVLVAKEIAAEIESKVQYPGEIKVNVIRETRAVEMAK
mgnify:CR=1 FL=1